MEDKKKIITYALVCIGALFSVGLLYKYFKSSKKTEEEKPKETKKEEKEETFVPVPAPQYEKKPLPSKEGESKIYFKTFSVCVNPLTATLQNLKIDDLTQEISPRIAFHVKSNQTVEEVIDVSL